jgi:mannose-6-phosphate isomerase
MTELYPLLFEPILSPRPWGGDSLHKLLGKPMVSGEVIGESWEIYTTSVIANGVLRGRTLGDVLKEYGDALAPHDGDDFPLLVKFLDAREWLSVQVHPDDAKARVLEGQPRGKTECWYVIHAEPDSKLAFGTVRPMTADEFREAVEQGKAEEVMAYVPVKAGDFLYVEAGTMHALGPGLVIYELQQSSDTTYRVYDWGRVGKDGKPRELHLEKALHAAELVPKPDPLTRYEVRPDPFGNEVAELIRGPYFALDRIRLHERETRFDTDGTCRLITVINGSMRLNDLVLEKGHSVLLPASLGAYTITQDGGAEFLIGWPA